MKKRALQGLKTACLIEIFLLSMSYMLNAQSPSYYVNGRYIYMIDMNNYYIETGTGPIYLDTHFLTIKFKEGMETAGINHVSQYFNLTQAGLSAGGYYVFKVNNPNMPYPAIFETMNQQPNDFPEVEKNFISYYGQYMDAREANDNPNINWWYLGSDGGGGLESSFYDYLDLPDAWNTTTGKSEVVVGIIDTGLDWGIEEKDELPMDNGLGYNFLANAVNPSNTNPDYTQTDNSHGTRMASIICSKTNNGKGIVGVAGGWKDPDEGNGITPMMLINGENDEINIKHGWSTALTALCINYATHQDIRLINMSFGISGLLPDEQLPIKAAIDYAIEKNDAIFVASAGNYGIDQSTTDYHVSFPASYEPVIAVGGVDENQIRYSFNHGSQLIEASCYGEGLDFVTTYLTWVNYGPNDPFIYEDNRISYNLGTSQSAALVTGVIGLMLSANPCLSGIDVHRILKESCFKNQPHYTFNTNKWNYDVGYGFVNARIALQLSLPNPGSEITTHEIWDAPKMINSDITIKHGGWLDIRNTAKFASGVRIIVETGGLLSINGGTLTSMCDDFWRGIEVHGNPNLPQYPTSNQGWIYIQRGKIENAQVGIGFCNSLDDISLAGSVRGGGGGILCMYDSQIINCQVGLTFAEYYLSSTYPNIIGKSTFRTDNNMLQIPSFTADIVLNSNTGLKIKGVQFLNEQDPSVTARGIGIHSYNSEFTVDNLKEGSEVIGSKFQNLDRGIYSENIGTNKFVRIYNTDFVNNRFGFYGSALIMPEFLNNNFNAYEGSDLSYCLYLDNCRQYLVEENQFYSDNPDQNKNIGLYIRNSGGQSVEVYNNRFSNFMIAADADGINRNTAYQTGLCFKCNDFISCSTDILIPKVTAHINQNAGIRQYQGYRGTAAGDAAGNTFSFGVNNMNYDNQLNPIEYIKHESAIPTSTKISPDLYTINTIGFSTNNGTVYTKTLSCPLKQHDNDKNELREKLVESNQEISITEMQLQAFTDGGNTSELNTTVQSAQNTQSLEVYDKLMNISPYLSEEVMKSSIENTNVLPDAMLRDILVANPHSAKSGELMQSLEERPIPLSEEMKDEVINGLNQFASMDLLEEQKTKWNDRWNNSQNELFRTFALDTLPERRDDSIVELLSNTEKYFAKQSLSLIELNRDNLTEAIQIINSIPNQFTLDQDMISENNNFSILVNELGLLRQSDPNYISAESLDQSNLSILALNDENLPGAIARNILHAAGLIDYNEPININTQEKSLRIVASPISTSPNIKCSINVYPNPAHDYCIVHYNISDNFGDASIKIIDLNGKAVITKKLLDKQNSIVVHLTNITSGNYCVCLLLSGVSKDCVQINLN